MPVIMLGWIPFRSTSLEQTFALYSIVFDLTSYDSLNLRENIYLICILILTGHIMTYFITKNFKFLIHRSNKIYLSYIFL